MLKRQRRLRLQKRPRSSLAQTALFALMGAVSFSTDLVVLGALLAIHPTTNRVALVAFNSLGFACGWVINYLGNKHLTFSQRNLRKGSMWRFGAVSVTGLVLNNLLLLWLLPQADMLLDTISLMLPTALVLALGTQAGTTAVKVLVGSVVGGWNYALTRAWAFRPERSTQPLA